MLYQVPSPNSILFIKLIKNMRVYPKCSDSISEPCESLNCYITLGKIKKKKLLYDNSSLSSG